MSRPPFTDRAQHLDPAGAASLPPPAMTLPPPPPPSGGDVASRRRRVGVPVAPGADVPRPDVKANHRAGLDFEQRDARLGWWVVLAAGLAAVALLGAWLVTS